MTLFVLEHLGQVKNMLLSWFPPLRVGWFPSCPGHGSSRCPHELRSCVVQFQSNPVKIIERWIFGVDEEHCAGKGGGIGGLCQRHSVLFAVLEKECYSWMNPGSTNILGSVRLQVERIFFLPLQSVLTSTSVQFYKNIFILNSLYTGI